jgi:2-dehydro-3-deoxygalactonokinase
VVGGGAPAESTRAYLSGLLICAEVAGMRTRMAEYDEVVLLGDGGLCELYRRAFDKLGVPSETFDGGAAAVDGLLALYRMGAGR